MFTKLWQWLRSLLNPQAMQPAPPAPSQGGGVEESPTTTGEDTETQMTTPYLHASETKLLLQVKKDLDRHEGYREYAYPDVIKPLFQKYPRRDWGHRPARDILNELGVSVATAERDGAPWTVGYGFTEGVNLDSRMPKITAERKLEELILEKDNQLARALPWYKDEATFVTKTILVNMAFQMGLKGLLGFRNTLAFVKAKKYSNAAANMRQSLWAKQTPSRASELARRMETQEIPSPFKAPERL